MKTLILILFLMLFISCDTIKGYIRVGDKKLRGEDKEKEVPVVIKKTAKDTMVYLYSRDDFMYKAKYDTLGRILEEEYSTSVIEEVSKEKSSQKERPPKTTNKDLKPIWLILIVDAALILAKYLLK